MSPTSVINLMEGNLQSKISLHKYQLVNLTISTMFAEISTLSHLDIERALSSPKPRQATEVNRGVEFLENINLIQACVCLVVTLALGGIVPRGSVLETILDYGFLVTKLRRGMLFMACLI